MAQNIYDNDDFFAKYSTFRRQVEGLDGAPEWASLRAMLPDMRGLRVLDLGCGFGCQSLGAGGGGGVGPGHRPFGEDAVAGCGDDER